MISVLGIASFYLAGKSLLAELLSLLWFVVFVSQQSCLYMSLILVPFSFVLMFVMTSNLLTGGLFFYIFVMIFIGGLLVLLVSVSSLSTQEQGMVVSLPLFLCSMLLVGSISYCCSSVMPSPSMVMILWSMETSYYMMIMSILILGLITISGLVFEFKGLVRSVCLFSVYNMPLFRGGE